MSSSRVVALGYIGVTGPDLNEWRTFTTEVLGASLGAGTTDDHLEIRIDERGYRIAVDEGPGGISYMGWEVPNAAALEALAADLDAAGVVYKEDAALAKERRVNGLITCTDPAGNQIEFFHGAYLATTPFVSPKGVRFVTSDRGPGDMGLGHVVFMFPDLAEAKHFYFDVLKFSVSDTITMRFGRPGGPAREMGLYFAHVNPRHHSLAFGEVPGAPTAFNHFMLEVEDIDMVGYALDRVEENNVELQLTLGRHSNDHMLSFYMKSPSGFNIEYGCSGRRIDDSVWTTANYDAAHYWGHHRAVVTAEAPVGR